MNIVIVWKGNLYSPAEYIKLISPKKAITYSVVKTCSCGRKVDEDGLSCRRFPECGWEINS